MTKYILVAFLFLITSAASAQKLTSGNITVSISNVKTESYKKNVMGAMRSVTEYTGDCNIEIKGSDNASFTFSTLQMDNDTMTLTITDEDGMGDALTYDLNTKKYEIAGKEFKAKNSKDINNIILSGILIYAQWLTADEG